MKKAIVAFAIAAIATTASATIDGSAHDLHAGWNGLTPRATAPLSACNFCHAPHNANTVGTYSDVPLWNRRTTNLGAGTYQVKVTALGNTPSPGGHSLTCLSCHDGVGDVGLTYASGDAFTTTGNAMPNGGSSGTRGTNVGSTYNGTNFIAAAPAGSPDLRDDHPVGIPYPATGTSGFADAATVTGATLKLYGGTSTVECGSCHDPHDNNTVGKFLRAANICVICHTK